MYIPTLPNALLEHLRNGLVKGEQTTYKIGLSTPNDKERVLIFTDAILEHYPGVEKPSHVIVWTDGCVHVFNYHFIEYIV